jgi:hypothetical protein
MMYIIGASVVVALCAGMAWFRKKKGGKEEPKVSYDSPA